jgi:hypothetical protein
VVIWYIFPHFGMLYQEKSGSPGRVEERKKLKLNSVKPFIINRAVKIRARNSELTRDQGCQIFLDAMYQNGGKYSKLPLNYQIAIKCTKWL